MLQRGAAQNRGYATPGMPAKEKGRGMALTGRVRAEETAVRGHLKGRNTAKINDA
jgi:hypothetical protein